MRRMEACASGAPFGTVVSAASRASMRAAKPSRYHAFRSSMAPCDYMTRPRGQGEGSDRIDRRHRLDEAHAVCAREERPEGPPALVTERDRVVADVHQHEPTAGLLVDAATVLHGVL